MVWAMNQLGLNGMSECQSTVLIVAHLKVDVFTSFWEPTSSPKLHVIGMPMDTLR